MNARALKRFVPGGRWAVIAVPFLWLLLFFAIPFLIVLKISFSRLAIAIPPYTPILEYVDKALTVRLNLGNYVALFTDSQYVLAYLSSIKIAAVSTLLCLLIGYPMAYFIARMKPSTRNIALMAVVLPSWISFLLRVYAWVGILDANGILNRALMGLGVIDAPLRILYTPLAAYDLGAKPWQAFLRITLPLSRAGIVAGCMLVMIPAVGEFVIPEMLGGPDTLMIGRVLWGEFFNNRDWPAASAVAIVMLLILLVPILVFNRFQQREMEGRLT